MKYARKLSKAYAFASLLWIAVLTGCDRHSTAVNEIEGRPAGPQRLTLTVVPAYPSPSDTATLTYKLTEAATGKPIRDLQVTHERFLHTFIVARDFSTFAHIHHEDFQALTHADIDSATFHFPYRFPHPGHYRVVTEYVQHDRSWLKQFDLTVGDTYGDERVKRDLSRIRTIGAYTAELIAPRTITAGEETAFTLHLTQQSLPVTNLKLLLGTEVHVAIWRSDGEAFGHTHSYTPDMAAMMQQMRGMGHDPAQMNAMMMTTMSQSPKLVFPGPDVPIHYQFATAGLYQMFFQLAPAGVATVFGFMVEVRAGN